MKLAALILVGSTLVGCSTGTDPDNEPRAYVGVLGMYPIHPTSCYLDTTIRTLDDQILPIKDLTLAQAKEWEKQPVGAIAIPEWEEVYLYTGEIYIINPCK